MAPPPADDFTHSLNFTTPHGFFAHADLLVAAAQGLTVQTARYLTGLSSGIGSVADGVGQLLQLVGTVDQSEQARVRAETIVRMNPRLQRLFRMARPLPDLADALEAEFVEFARAGIDADVQFATRPDVRAALEAVRDRAAAVVAAAEQVRAQFPGYARAVGREIRDMRALAAETRQQLAHMDDDVVVADPAGARARREMVVRLRRMIKETVTTGDLFSLARPQALLGLDEFQFQQAREGDAEQAQFIRGVRAALLAVPADLAVRQAVLHHRVMGAMWAVVSNCILAPPDEAISGRTAARAAHDVWTLVQPLRCPVATAAEVAGKRRNVVRIAEFALEMRQAIHNVSGADQAFMFSGPAAGEAFLLHADRVRVSCFEGPAAAAAAADGGVNGKIAYTEFGGLARIVRAAGTEAGAVPQTRVIWETRPIVVVEQW